MCKQRTNSSAGLFSIVISYVYEYFALKNLKGIISTNVTWGGRGRGRLLY